VSDGTRTPRVLNTQTHPGDVKASDPAVGFAMSGPFCPAMTTVPAARRGVLWGDCCVT